MSHLSILPTLFRDAGLLAASLDSLGHTPIRSGVVRGFAGQEEPVELQVRFERGVSLGWRRQPDGSLALVGDLQRLSRSRSVQAFLGRLTRAYAARQAVQDAAHLLPDAQLQVSA